MKKLPHLASALCLVLAVAAVSAPSPAFAKHHHHHGTTAAHRKLISHSRRSAMIKEAQTSLINLGYLHDKADGLLGPRTKRAIMAFQKGHKLHADGVLTKQTYDAIIKADSARAMAALPVAPPIIMPVQVPREQLGLNGKMDTQYADPLMGGDTVAGDSNDAQSVRTKPVQSRFAKLDVNENINGSLRRYNFTLDGLPILQIDNQPSIIGISETYALGDEDAIILTTYHDGDHVCPYKYYILSLMDGRNELRTIPNCTHGYQARKIDNTLFLTFPEVDDQRTAGATFRYETGDLEKL